MSLIIYVSGAKNGRGLGNCLFHIASAVYYRETFGGTILLAENNDVRFGHPRFSLRMKKNGKDIPYTDTILSKFGFYKKLEDHRIMHNDYTNVKCVPDKNILISGYSQNLNLFKEYLHKLPEYLNLQDKTIISYIQAKYKNLDKGICIGLRVGEDFAHMKTITRESYINALKKLRQMGINIDNLFIISDVADAWLHTFDLQDIYPATFINESDVVQLYAGLMCRHYILSESTFHLWIAYLGTIDNDDKKVIYFVNTDITRRPLALDNWIRCSP